MCELNLVCISGPQGQKLAVIVQETAIEPNAKEEEAYAQIVVEFGNEIELPQHQK